MLNPQFLTFSRFGEDNRFHFKIHSRKRLSDWSQHMVTNYNLIKHALVFHDPVQHRHHHQIMGESNHLTIKTTLCYIGIAFIDMDL